MKVYRLVFIFVAALLLNLNLAYTAPVENTSGPHIEFGEKNFDFGNVDEGAVLEHAFRFFNRGDQPLEIEKVSPS